MKGTFLRFGLGAITLGLIVAPQSARAYYDGGLSFDLPPVSASEYWTTYDSRPLLASQVHSIEANHFAMPQSAKAIQSILGLPTAISYDGVAYWNMANEDGSISSEQLAIGFHPGKSPSAYGSWRVYRYAG